MEEFVCLFVCFTPPTSNLEIRSYRTKLWTRQNIYTLAKQNILRIVQDLTPPAVIVIYACMSASKIVFFVVAACCSYDDFQTLIKTCEIVAIYSLLWHFPFPFEPLFLLCEWMYKLKCTQIEEVWTSVKTIFFWVTFAFQNPPKSEIEKLHMRQCAIIVACQKTNHIPKWC